MQMFKEKIEGVLSRVKADYMGDNSYHKRVMMDTVQNLYDAFQAAEKRIESKETKIINAKQAIEEVIKCWENCDNAKKKAGLLTVADNLLVLRKYMDGFDITGYVKNLMQYYTFDVQLYTFMLFCRDRF